MEVCTLIPGHKFEPTVLALGNFDGIHLGHQELLKHGLEKARSLKTLFSVLLFDPHPLKVLHPDRKLELITGKDEKIMLFEKFGVDKVFLLPFSPKFAETTPQEFVENILLKIGAVHVTVGFNYSFGCHGKGKPGDLEKFGETYNFGVSVVQAQMLDDRVISSTEIRRALLNGDIDLAKAMMGRAPTIIGTVVHGDGRGRDIGFPTANIETHEDLLIPKNGVYAVTAKIDGRIYGGIMNIGIVPTFKTGQEKTIEIHFFDFHGDLYRKDLFIDIQVRLRAEKKFSGVKEITEQLGKDMEAAKQKLQKQNFTIFME
ncbi:MAG: bifunctional riboflavin kinase/FAD synthetase [Dehalobacter sp. 4CP]|uniref:bifunctional riboflavin kinase/FAD synthetase n=1 Tax=Dehalobacter sp. CP TaxID=2594474 RepID=UPI0013C73593|nr:bifunctional riboflavin kinase/FAD synthetase [Dehalobacter sp. 4CP]